MLTLKIHNEKNQDADFAFASHAYKKEICEWFGPAVVAFLSIDDKERVTLGLAAAKSQAPILMHMEYKVRLPDHDFTIAQKHKLIPSVYAACAIDRDKQPALTYSGPTHIAVRSGNHDTSNVFTHTRDYEHINTFGNHWKVTGSEEVNFIMMLCRWRSG